MIHHPVILQTERVRLEPLEARHLPELIATCNNEALWELTFSDNPFTNNADTQKWLEEALNRAAFYAFVIVDKASNGVIGSTRFGDIRPDYKAVEIGWTFVAQSHWRTHVNTECKYLLFRYAFEELHCNRVGLKASGKNLRSRNAIARIGATYEGTLRSMRIHPINHEVHDVSYYSVLAEEWPRVKSQLEARIRDSLSSVSR